MSQEIRLIFAEDDMEDRMIILDLFKDVYPDDVIHFAEDGIKLLSALGTMEDKLPSLIILDLNMPRLNGVETLKRLKANEKYMHIPTIVLSTSVNEKQKQECMLLGAAHYITKPSTYRESLDVAHFIHGIALQAAAN